ncbi:RNase A-like domain-containing protein, partial [Streptomyces sp. B1866]|uniref:RNase A-like domain-containing protein n=1 Tax=Streptomyces sp. B1866 TaxID=3075431 RepID=UPI00289045F5
RGWLRLAGVLPVAAASAHHLQYNYAAEHPRDHGAQSLVDGLGGWLWLVPLGCLAVAMAADWWQVRRARLVVPGVLLGGERAGRPGALGLAGYGAWCVPWSALLVWRFARLRRALLYTAFRPAYAGREVLHQAVVQTVARLDASDHEAAWRGVGWRTIRQAHREGRGTRRRWTILLSLVLAVPAVLFWGVASFPGQSGVREWFTTGAGPRLLVGFGIAGLAWTGWLLIRLATTWRATQATPLAETLTVLRFRLWTALGTAVTGMLLFVRLQNGMAPTDAIIPNRLHLIDALHNFLAYAGAALLLLALFALFPPGGGLALATTGVAAGTLSAEAAIHAAALGTLGIVLMSASEGGSGGNIDGWNAWPREKRKGKTKPEHRADIKNDEGKNGSHTIDRHVNKTTHDMRNRLRADANLKADSRFIDENSAQRFTDEAIRRKQGMVETWLKGGRSRLELPRVEFGEQTGLTLSRSDFLHGNPPSRVDGVKVILKRDPSAPGGFRVLTSYPVP